MKTTANHQLECVRLPIVSSRDRGWENLQIGQFQHPAGEGKFHHGDECTICLSLAPRPVRMLQTLGDKTYTGLYGKGDLCITPAQMTFFARWESDDRFLQIRIASELLQTVASEALEINPDRLELLPEFRIRDPQIEAIGMMLLNELKQENLGGRLYIESLANILAVHLLRQYAATKPNLPIYEGGLSPRQLQQVLAYIHEYLDRDIKLVDLASLLGMSQFHFSHLFKQAIGISPYQYLLQQRVERAKQMLKQTARSPTDKAFLGR